MRRAKHSNKNRQTAPGCSPIAIALKQRGLISEEVRNHQFRFKEIIDPESDRAVFLVEHEVNSLHHPMFNRLMVNRDSNESARHYRRRHDALIPYS